MIMKKWLLIIIIPILIIGKICYDNYKVSAIPVGKISKEATFNKKSDTNTNGKNDQEDKTIAKTAIKTSNELKIDFEAQNLDDIYYEKVVLINYNCKHSERIGNAGDGGWDVCFDENLSFVTGSCLSYSFGINYVWEFDDIVATKYKCTVRTFDPSMAKEKDEVKRPSGVNFYKIGLGKTDETTNQGWKIMKMSSILKKFQETKKTIDILKIDIEAAEWNSFESMVEDGVFNYVRQLMFETHVEDVHSRSNYARYLKIWQNLFQLGFRQWKVHANPYCKFTKGDKVRHSCFEHYMININLVKS